MSKLVVDSVFYRCLDGDVMVSVRQGLEVSQALFASQCGHSQQFQSRIEVPGLHELTTGMTDKIEAAVKHFSK